MQKERGSNPNLTLNSTSLTYIAVNGSKNNPKN